MEKTQRCVRPPAVIRPLRTSPLAFALAASVLLSCSEPDSDALNLTPPARMVDSTDVYVPPTAAAPDLDANGGPAAAGPNTASVNPTEPTPGTLPEPGAANTAGAPAPPVPVAPVSGADAPVPEASGGRPVVPSVGIGVSDLAKSLAFYRPDGHDARWRTAAR